MTSTKCNLSEIIKKVRTLEKKKYSSPEEIFFLQAELLANCEDNYSYSENIKNNINRFKDLNDNELRYYISWRTKWKHGEKNLPSASFALLYLGELVNLVQYDDPIDTFEEIQQFRKDIQENKFSSLEGTNIDTILSQTILDFVIYYELDSNLAISEVPKNLKPFVILENPSNYSTAEIFKIIRFFAKDRLEKSFVSKLIPSLAKDIFAESFKLLKECYDTVLYEPMLEEFFGHFEQCHKRYFFFKDLSFNDEASFKTLKTFPIYKFETSSVGWHKKEFCPNLDTCVLKLSEFIEAVEHSVNKVLQLSLNTTCLDSFLWIEDGLFDVAEQILEKAQISELETKELRFVKACARCKYESYSEKDLNSETIPEPIQKFLNLKKKNESIQEPPAKLFVKQAEALQDFEDDFDGFEDIVKAFDTKPNFNDLSISQLRTYISWRTLIKQGIFTQTDSYQVKLYVSELINLIGCTGIKDAYNKLINFRDRYQKISQKDFPEIDQAIIDFEIYYLQNLSELGTARVSCEEELLILNDIQNTDKDVENKIFNIILKTTNDTITSSKLYQTYPNLVRSVLIRIFRKIDNINKKNNPKSVWFEGYYGNFTNITYNFFESFHFAPKEHTTKNKEIIISPLFYYKYAFENGSLVSCKFNTSKKFEDRSYFLEPYDNFIIFLKGIDAELRYLINFRYKKRRIIETWQIQIVKESLDEYVQETQKSEQKKRIQNIKINLSCLDNIRSNSEETKEKLLTEEEKLGTHDNATTIKLTNNNLENNNTNLSPQEKRFLTCLLKNTSVNWIIKEGLTIPILCDRINEKLYSVFEDNVIENGVLIEDYIDDLKKKLSA